MLVELDIQNFAIIKNLKVKFQNKMTALIGETGAGKSILIDALSLLLGHRAQSEMIRSGENKARITGLFTLSNQRNEVQQLCDEYGLPLDGDDLIISRELTSKGRNVIRINGQLTTITVLKQLGKYLVDIHGQSDQQILMDQDRQIDLVDEYAGKDFNKQLVNYQQIYHEWRTLKSTLQNVQKNTQELAQKHDILQFQNDELTQANLADPNEDEELENEFTKLNNFQKIAETANYLTQIFDDEENGLTTLLGKAEDEANELANYGDDFKNMAQAVSEGVYSLSDARSDLSSIMDGLDFDEDRYHYVTNRLDELNTLKKKYGPTLADVFKFYEKVQKELGQFETGNLDESSLLDQIKQVEDQLEIQAQKIHKLREQTAIKLEAAIKKELKDLYMDKARFAIRFNHADTFNKLGFDEVAFYIAPNPGEDLLPLVKIVSGGEQSRLMLALKAVFSRVEPVGTMIFDEIDTGVSGRVSEAIGRKMHSIAENKQVITITHSPQVAAASDHRDQIAKVVEDGETYTKVTPLTEKQSITAIAQMMAGADVTKAAEQNAADLIKNNHM